MVQKKYMDIEVLHPSFSHGFERGDYIVVQEKIDGANFSIRYNAEDNTIRAFSRKKELDFGNDLRGAWGWSQTLNVDDVKNVLGDNLILFGEWNVPHAVKYPEDKYNNAYFYDVYDTEKGRYLCQDTVKEKINELKLNYVPVFYQGEFTSWEDIMKYVGKTQMGGEYGEGIVVKNMTKLNNPNTRTPFYTKIVCEAFRETKGHKGGKVVDENQLKEREMLQSLTETIVTEPRVRKLICKMVDDGLIPEDWNNHDMATIAKNLGKEIYYDCQKEEPEVVSQIGQTFGKIASSTAMRHARNILDKRYGDI